MTSKNIIRTTVFVAMIAILGKVIGFGREALIAAYYGVNNSTDAYFLARNMPALLFPAVCNSMATAFLSIYVTKNSQQGEVESDEFASKALVVTLLLSTSLSIFSYIFSPYIVPLFAPGFDRLTLNLATDLTRITMAAFTLTMAQYMLSAILNSKKFFYGSQISGVLNSIFIIILLICFGNNKSVYFLTWTTIGGLLIQVVMLFIFMKKRFRFNLRNFEPISDDIKQMFRLSGPILLGNSIIQISQIADKILASNLVVGAVSALSYTNSLSSIVTSVFIESLSTVLYPTLTENASNNDLENYSKNLSHNLLLLILIITPISIITFIFSKDIITIVYARGKFDQLAAELTNTAFAFYSLGFVFIAIREVVNRGFYAIGDSKTPMRNGLLSVGLNIIISVIFTKYIGIAGITLGTSISAAISSFILLASMNKRIEQMNFSSFIPTISKIIISTIATIITLIIVSKTLLEYNPLIRIIIASVLGFFIYTVILFFLRCKEIVKILDFLRLKIRKIRSL